MRDLMLMLCADLQPPINKRIRDMVQEMGGDVGEWVKTIYNKVFDAYEAFISKTQGKYSVGDQITLADVCLTHLGALNLRQQADSLSKWPRIEAIVKNCCEMEEFSV